jgi:hypothetical protein
MLSLRRIVALVVFAGVASFVLCPASYALEVSPDGPGDPMPAAAVEEGGPSFSFAADAALASKYIWRGINLDDEAVFQPSVTVGYGGLSFNIWGSMELTDANTYPGYGTGEGEFTEVDYTLDYSFDITDTLSGSVGAIYYDFPNTGFDSTTELYAGISADVLLSPSLTVYQDVDEAEGTYVLAGLGHTLCEWEMLNGDATGALDIGTSAAWGSSDHNNFYYGVDDGALTNWDLTVAMPLTYGNFSLTPSVTYSRLLDDDIRDNMADDDNLYGAIAVGWSF